MKRIVITIIKLISIPLLSLWIAAAVAENMPQPGEDAYLTFESTFSSMSSEGTTMMKVAGTISLLQGGVVAGLSGNAPLVIQKVTLPSLPAGSSITYGTEGVVAAMGEINNAGDEMLFLLRVPDASLTITSPIPVKPSISVPAYYMPLVSFHSGALGGEATMATSSSQCGDLISSAGLGSNRDSNSPSLPSLSSKFAGSLGNLMGSISTGTSQSPVCLLIRNWEKLPVPIASKEKTWVKTFDRDHFVNGGGMSENTQFTYSTCKPIKFPKVRNPWTDNEHHLDPVRDAILTMSPEQFKTDTDAHDELWRMVGTDLKTQTAFGESTIKQSGQDGESVSIPKRDNQADFIEGVIGKTIRNKYQVIGQMDDMIRGRFDMKTGEGVKAVAKIIGEQEAFPVKIDAIELPRRKVEQPLCDCGEGFGYPRYHVVVRSTPNNITNEWQIGTLAASKVYEKRGITVPEEMLQDVSEGKIRNDLHDVDYDIFRQCVGGGKIDSDKSYYEKLGLKRFGEELDKVSAAAGCLGNDYKQLDSEIARLHKMAAPLLQRVVDTFGIKKVRNCYH